MYFSRCIHFCRYLRNVNYAKIMNCVGYLLLLWGYKYMGNVLMLKRSPSSTPIKAYCYCML